MTDANADTALSAAHRAIAAGIEVMASLKRQLAERTESHVQLMQATENLRQRLAACQNERNDAVIALAKRSEQIAACRDALASAHAEFGDLAAERDRLENDLTLEKSSCRVLQAKLRTTEAERDRLRAACKAMHQDAVFLSGETTQKCALCGFVGDITRTDLTNLHFADCSVPGAEAALDPKPETSDGAAGEGKS